MVSAKPSASRRVARNHYAAARGADVHWLQRQRIKQANEDAEITALMALCDSLRAGG